jgi:glycerol-3-phosphate dehydrogenase
VAVADYDAAVIGAGVVGAAIARELSRYHLRCVLIEAGDDVGTGTSKANTAIRHTGFDARPGTLETALLVRGFPLLTGFAEQAGIPIQTTGALLIAWDDTQLARLDEVSARARANGYAAVRPLSAGQVYDAEPNLGPGARGGLLIPDEGILCPFTTPLALATDAVTAGVRPLLSSPVTGIRPADGRHALATPAGEITARWVINAAGLRSDEIDKFLGFEDVTVTPRRGQLIVYDKLARRLISRILLPVPTPRTKGVLVAPTVFGNVLVGPTAEDVADKTATQTTAAGIASLAESGQRILPGLADEEVTATYSGLRAATEHADYQVRCRPDRRYVTVVGQDSAAALARACRARAVARELSVASSRGASWPRMTALMCRSAAAKDGSPVLAARLRAGAPAASTWQVSPVPGWNGLLRCTDPLVPSSRVKVS